MKRSMARLSLIQKQEPGAGKLQPVLWTQAGVRSQTKAGERPARTATG